MKQTIKAALLKAKAFFKKFIRYGGYSLVWPACWFFGCWVIFRVYETLGFGYDEFFAVYDRYLSLVAFENVEWFVIAVLCFSFFFLFLTLSELFEGFFQALFDISRYIKLRCRSRKKIADK